MVSMRQRLRCGAGSKLRQLIAFYFKANLSSSSNADQCNNWRMNRLCWANPLITPTSSRCSRFAQHTVLAHYSPYPRCTEDSLKKGKLTFWAPLADCYPTKFYQSRPLWEPQHYFQATPRKFTVDTNKRPPRPNCTYPAETENSIKAGSWRLK